MPYGLLLTIIGALTLVWSIAWLPRQMRRISERSQHRDPGGRDMFASPVYRAGIVAIRLGAVIALSGGVIFLVTE